MKSVGIKVLKDKLSSYLKLVRQGEVVLVTDRDEVIAEIRKPSSQLRGHSNSIDSILLDLEHQGIVSRAQESDKGAKNPAMSIKDLPHRYAKFDLENLLSDIRSDR